MYTYTHSGNTPRKNVHFRTITLLPSRFPDCNQWFNGNSPTEKDYYLTITDYYLEYSRAYSGFFPVFAKTGLLPTVTGSKTGANAHIKLD